MRRDYIEGLNMLASLRLCSNTPGQLAIQTALGGLPEHQGPCCADGAAVPPARPGLRAADADPGRQRRQAQGGGFTCSRGWTPKVYPIADDQQFAYELLAEEKVLIVQGTGFNWPEHDHFRLVFLPNVDDLREAVGRIDRFLAGYRRRVSS